MKNSLNVHPAAHSKDYSKRHFIFCDDSDDRFERHYQGETQPPVGLSPSNYITWASLLVHENDVESTLSDIKFLKNHWAVGKIHFSGDESQRFRDLFYNNSIFRKSFFDLIESFKGQYFFSSLLNDKIALNEVLPVVLEDFKQISSDDWRDPKFISLYWHMMKLDRFLPESDNEYYSYADRISSVDKKIEQITAWYGKSHYHLHKINGLICFKTNTSERDDMALFLELADFIASSIRRTFQGIRAQDTRLIELSDLEISNRIVSIQSSGEQDLVKFTLDMVRTSRYQLLDAIVCGVSPDGSSLKL
jgi:hypothetical protein